MLSVEFAKIVKNISCFSAVITIACRPKKGITFAGHHEGKEVSRIQLPQGRFAEGARIEENLDKKIRAT